VVEMIVRRRKLPVFFHGTLIDLETTGLPNQQNSEVVTLGIVSGNELKIVQRTVEENFEAHVRELIRGLPRPFYAFNKVFEEQMLGIEIDRELQAEEFEKKREAIKIMGLHDPFDGLGYKVVDAWNNYITSHDKHHLCLIMNHNEACLLLETCLAIVRWRRRYKGYWHAEK